MEEVRASEVRATLEDLMYVSILEKFIVLGIDMLPRLDGERSAAWHGTAWRMAPRRSVGQVGTRRGKAAGRPC